MSYRNHWNTAAERHTLDCLIALTEEMLEDASSSSSSDSGMVFFDDSSSSSTGSFDSSIDEMIETTIGFGEYIVYESLEDESIDFYALRVCIQNLEASTCILNFRFRKSELQELADLLWPKMSTYLPGDKEKITCINCYTASYEAGILLVLYRLASSRR
jgi:hypothetical protein